MSVKRYLQIPTWRCTGDKSIFNEIVEMLRQKGWEVNEQGLTINIIPKEVISYDKPARDIIADKREDGQEDARIEPRIGGNIQRVEKTTTKRTGRKFESTSPSKTESTIQKTTDE